MRGPDEFEDIDAFIKEAAEGKKEGTGYPALSPLGDRAFNPTMHVSEGGAGSEAELLAKFGYSMSGAYLTKLAFKYEAYQRDGSISDELQQLAVKSTNALADFVLNANCTNRMARMETEEIRAMYWENEAKNLKLENPPDWLGLFTKWGSAFTFCQQVRIISERDGIERARPYFDNVDIQEAVMRETDMEISQLPPAYHSLTLCKIRHFKIQKEIAFASAMGYPQEDFTDFKKLVRESKDIHDMVDMMPWPARESYRQVVGSMMDGKEHRDQQTALNAGQMAQRERAMGMGAPYGMMPQHGMPGMPMGEEDEKKKAIWQLFGGPGNPALKPPKRRIRSAR